jgi:hypothetical protein
MHLNLKFEFPILSLLCRDWQCFNICCIIRRILLNSTFSRLAPSVRIRTKFMKKKKKKNINKHQKFNLGFEVNWILDRENKTRNVFADELI